MRWSCSYIIICSVILTLSLSTLCNFSLDKLANVPNIRDITNFPPCTCILSGICQIDQEDRHSQCGISLLVPVFVLYEYNQDLRAGSSPRNIPRRRVSASVDPWRLKRTAQGREGYKKIKKNVPTETRNQPHDQTWLFLDLPVHTCSDISRDARNYGL